jgi:polar amino acid transport system substrate-binding protein
LHSISLVPICFWSYGLHPLATLVGLANAETPTRLDAIVGTGALQVGLTEDYWPFSFADASRKVEGIEADMAMSLAQSRGVKLVLATSAT